jgi:hypothetical protein
MNSVSSLQDLCIKCVLKDPKFRTLEGMLLLFSDRIDLDLPAFLPIKELVGRNISHYYSYLIEKVGLLTLKDNFPNIDWDKHENDHVASKKELDYFHAMKGTIIEREESVVDYVSNTYPYTALRSGLKWPSNVDPTRREDFLNDDDFQQCFKMSKEEFRRLPLYLRQRMKKDKELF